MIVMRNITLIIYVLWATMISYPKRIFLKIKYRDDRKRYNENYYTLRRIVNRMIKIIGIEVDFRDNNNNFSKKDAYMYVGNHRSNIDSLLLISYKKQPIIFIGKDEIKKMPIIGAWFVDIGAIFINRDDIRSSLEVINKGIENIKKGYSVVIFPEGSRTKEDCVKEFKPGSFKLSIRSKANVIPFAIYNTENAFEMHKLFYPAKVGLCVSEIIDCEKHNLDKTVELASYVNKIVSDMYDIMKGHKSGI